MSNHRRSNAGPNRRAVLKFSAGSALAGGILGLRPLTRSTLSEEKVNGGPVIDTHIHAVSPSLPGLKPKPPEIDKLYQSPPQAMADRLKAEMAAGRVEVAFGMGSLGGTIADPLGIARTLILCSLVPGMRAIGIADPRRNDPGWLKAVEAQIDGNRAKIVAFKAYLGYLHFGPEDPAYIPYYRLAEKYDLPVIVHTGDNRSTTVSLSPGRGRATVSSISPSPAFRFVFSGRRRRVDGAQSELEVEHLVPPSHQPPGQGVGAAIDLGGASQAGLELQIRVIDRDDDFINGRERLGLTRLGIGLGSDLALGHVGKLGGDFLPTPLGDFGDLALVGLLGPAVDLDPGIATGPDQMNVALVENQVSFQFVGIADLAKRSFCPTTGLPGLSHCPTVSW